MAQAQHGLITRTQLRADGISRGMVQHRIATERWVARSPLVIGTTTGELTRRQLMWLGVLHAGGPALIGDLTAAEVSGLSNWHRDEVTVLVPQGNDLGPPLDGIRFVETRRPLTAMRRLDHELPVCRIEPAVLHFAAYQRSSRTAEGVIAATVQQGLTTPERLLEWVARLRPLRWARMFRQSLGEISDGAQSVAELDVLRMCRQFGLATPRRQTKRQDAGGRIRFTDCEWLLPDGRLLVLEVDGAFHMEIAHWEDDIARQRALAARDRVQIRCTARELRDTPWSIARDLRILGVPRAA
ncbi:hypothetical protein [Microbacterium panaciterrae]|uniref:DUF559 domain-containing protein n=1 Tax=Microbacterium panaciterrae TaxID=985759 RepID=A0ABP8PTG9_9MICO